MSIRAHSRSKGHCVAAALAYRLGCDVTDSRTGIRHDFSRRAQRGDVVASGFAYGAQAPAWNRDDVQAFADSLEGAERRKNSIVCRDVELALPHELTPAQREGLAARWAQHLATQYNAPVAYAVHRPDRRSDERNHHVHCLMSTRALGEDGTPGAKLRQFHVRAKSENDNNEKERSRTDSGGSDEIHKLRGEWEVMCNQALAEAGINAAIAMGRLEDPRDRAPNLTRGEVEAERKGWKKRHPKTRQLPLRVAQLVVDDGVCVTKRGRELARHVTTRTFIEHVTGKPVPRPQALPTAEPEPEQALAAADAIQPVRIPSPEPERPAHRRRRRRAPRIRAVEASTTPAPTSRGHVVLRPEQHTGARSVATLDEVPQLPAPTPIPAPEHARSAHSAVRAAEPPPPAATPIALPERHSAITAVELPPTPQRPPERRPEAHCTVVLADAPQLPVPTPIPAPERTQSVHSAACAAKPPALPAATPIALPERRIETHNAVAAVELPPTPQRPPERRSRSNARGIVRAAEIIRIPVPTTITRRLAEIVRALRDLAARRARFLSTPKPAARQEDDSISETERVRRRRAGIVQAHPATHGVAPAQNELSQAREWLTRRKKPGSHGTSIPAIADSVARQRLTGNPVLSEFHPERYSKRPPLPTAISELAPQAAPSFHGDRFGPIPDGWNTGACRTRDGAEQAAKVLQQAIDDIARQHFDGHTDPRDYEPGWFKPSVESAKKAAMQAWQAIRETAIDRMVTAAADPEAIEIRRRRRQENTDKQARERAAQKRRAQIATAASQPIKPDHGQDRWD